MSARNLMQCRFSLAALGLCCAPLGALGAQPQASPPRLPSKAEAQAVCRMVAARGPAIATMLVRDGELDANNDGVLDAVSVDMRGGTMRGEDLAIRPRGAARNSTPIDVRAEGFQPGDYLPFGARWLPHGGKVYTLYFDAEDLRYPSYLGYIDATNTEHLLCDFASDDRETLRPVGGRSAEALCQMVAQKRASYAAVGEDTGDLSTDRWMTRVAGRITVDYANRGTATPLALLSFESGAGRGCAFSYFDLIENGKIASSGDAHATLMTLQGVALSNQGADVYTSGRCDERIPLWFVRDGVTYLDIAGGADVRGMEPSHEVAQVRGDKIETVCKATFSVSWKVKSMGREFR